MAKNSHSVIALCADTITLMSLHRPVGYTCYRRLCDSHHTERNLQLGIHRFLLVTCLQLGCGVVWCALACAPYRSPPAVCGCAVLLSGTTDLVFVSAYFKFSGINDETVLELWYMVLLFWFFGDCPAVFLKRNWTNKLNFSFKIWQFEVSCMSFII